MASRLSWLGSCTNAQLSILARAVGINSTGTKHILVSHLLDRLPKDSLGSRNLPNPPQAPQEPCRILSIDMGIRNLAYCCLVLPHTPPLTATEIGKPVLQDWTRLVIAEESTKPKRAERLVLTNATKEMQRSAEVMKSNPKEAFDPATYSQHAYDLVTTLLKRLNPSHILIERQRFRSMGGSAVQEWTLRVNMFEAMLYAVLKTLSESGFWEGIVHPIAPAKVSSFWIANEHGALTEGSGSKSAKTKTAKIDLVTEWLKDGHRFDLHGTAAQLGEAYLRKQTKRKGNSSLVEQKSSGSKTRIVAQDSIGKLDDLADCLLQGMAWIKWEENRRLILVKGVEALVELETG